MFDNGYKGCYHSPARRKWTLQNPACKGTGWRTLWLVHDELVSQSARLPAKDLCPVNRRHFADPALLLHRRVTLDSCAHQSGTEHAHPFSHVDSESITHGDMDRKPGEHHPDGDSRRYAHAQRDATAGGQRHAHAYRNRHIDPFADANRDGHPHAVPHANRDSYIHGYGDPHAYGHGHRHGHGNTDGQQYAHCDCFTNQYSHRDRNLDSNTNADLHPNPLANADGHADGNGHYHIHLDSNPGAGLASGARRRIICIKSEAIVKRRRVRIELTERQQLILAVLLVILVAISLLYCLGLGSLLLRQAWRNTTLPWDEATSPVQNVEMTPVFLPGESPLPTAVVP
jgi:hypothetical protein